VPIIPGSVPIQEEPLPPIRSLAAGGVGALVLLTAGALPASGVSARLSAASRGPSTTAPSAAPTPSGSTPSSATPGTTIAPAGGPPTVAGHGADPATVKAQADAAINRRLSDLQAAATLIAQTSWLGDDQSRLQAVLSTARSGGGGAPGLSALESTINGESDPAALHAEVATITATYRVYAVVLPQVHLVRAADGIDNQALPALRRVDAELKTAIAAEAAAQRDVTAAQTAETDLEAQIAAMTTATSGLSTQVLAVTPAAWNADGSVLVTSRQALGRAEQALRAASRDVHTATGALR